MHIIMIHQLGKRFFFIIFTVLLFTSCKEEQTKLVDDLRLVLEKFDFSEVIRKRAEQLDASKQILANQPLQIYIG